MTRRMMISLGMLAVVCVWGCDDNSVEPGITVIPGSLDLRTQTDVDYVAGVVEIEGDLRISTQRGGDPIFDLSPLSSLVRIGENLSISDNDYLADLRGLSSLELIGRSLNIGRDAVGDSLAGLSSLRAVGSLNMEWIDDVTLLSDFISFRIFETCDLRNISGLEDLSGLDDLDHVKRLKLRQLDDLVSLAGISSLESLEDLTIEANSVLMDLSGLPILPELRVLHLNMLPPLESLAGLPATPKLQVVNLRELDSLTSLNNLPVSNARMAVGVYRCPALPPELIIPSIANLSALKLFSCDSIERIVFPGPAEGDWGLEISGCENLTDLSSLDVVAQLNYLVLDDCENLSVFPSMLELIQPLDVIGASTPTISLISLPHVTTLDWLTFPVDMHYITLKKNPHLSCDFWDLPIESAYSVKISDNPGIDDCSAVKWGESLVSGEWNLQVYDNGPCLDR